MSLGGKLKENKCFKYLVKENFMYVYVKETYLEEFFSTEDVVCTNIAGDSSSVCIRVVIAPEEGFSFMSHLLSRKLIII